MLEVLNDPAEVEAVRPEWSRLWRDDPRATPFQSPEWLLAWSRHLFRGGKLWVVTQRCDGQLVSVLPCFRWGDRLEKLSFMGCGVSDYLDLIGAPISCVTGDWEATQFEEIRKGSPLLTWGAAERCSVCPVLRLPGSMDEVMAGLDGKFRMDLRRSRNRLERAGRVEIESTTEITDLFRLHASRWCERDQTGVLAEESLDAFHREVAEGFGRLGILRLYRLKLDGCAVAVIYAFAHRARWYAYLSGFDPEASKLSPGAVLLTRLVERAIDEGAEEFDFLRGAEEYKYKWGAVDRESVV